MSTQCPQMQHQQMWTASQQDLWKLMDRCTRTSKRQPDSIYLIYLAAHQHHMRVRWATWNIPNIQWTAWTIPEVQWVTWALTEAQWATWVRTEAQWATWVLTEA